jgi:hypothetical protein
MIQIQPTYLLVIFQNIPHTDKNSPSTWQTNTPNAKNYFYNVILDLEIK